MKRWRDIDYLNKIVGENTRYKTETSKSNHFMYWKSIRDLKKYKEKTGWVPPTGTKRLTFSNWLKTAVAEHNYTLEDKQNLYFRVSSGSSQSFLFRELPFFQPKESLFIVDPEEQRGIHCRFGKFRAT